MEKFVLKPGARVVRGPDWNSKKQDSGEGYVGTVIFVPKSEMADKKVTVIWDSGRELRYRAGHDGKYDLRVFDTAQIGIKHEYVACSECKETPIAGIRWKCSSCPDISLCSPCYMADKHDVRHGFVRIDVEKATPWAVQKRAESRPVDSRGLFVGTEVMRGPHWKWKNVDGGEGEIGTVTKLKEWNSQSQRGGVSVLWKNSKEEHLHRLGGEGCVDVIFNSSKQSKSGGKYYPEHLPLVDVVSKGNFTVALKPSDKVKVCMDVKALKQLQDNSDKHSPWRPEMDQCVEMEGTIVQLLHRGEVARVQYVDGQVFDLNRKALTRMHTFSKDDVVEILGDKEKVKMLQAGHGGWNDEMEQVLRRQGRIARIDSDGDVRVKVDDRVWIFNPVCIQAASSQKGAEADAPPSLMGTSVVMDDDDSSEEMEMSISGKDVSETIARLFVDMLKVQPPVQAASANIVQAASQNDLNTIQQILSQKGDKVNFAQDGKTALHLACYEGHSQVVSLLLKYKADLDLKDGEGDSALHYAAFGKETETMKQLLNAKADVNIVNKAGHSPLHISIGKACEEAVEILVQHGSDVNIKAADGDTTMHDAVQQKLGQPRIMHAVLRGRNADYRIPNKDGFNVLQWAGLKNSVKAMDLILTMNKSFVNDQTADGKFTVLHIVAANNFVEATNCLVAKSNANVNVDIGDRDKKTPLHYAVNGGHKQVIELLIAAESDVNAQDNFGNTALHLALSRSDPTQDRERGKILGTKQDHEVTTQIICLLLESRANTTLKNKDGDTPLDLASDPMVRKFMEKLAEKAKHNKFETTKRGINLPSNWDPMEKDKPFTRVLVSVKGGGILKMEYENVSKKFHCTLPQAKIFSIQRVQNMFLWEVYYLKKRQLEGQYGIGGANELELFHGTLPDKIDKICKENLDFRLAGERVGAIFGQGTYFAVEAKYSDLYAQADDQRHKFMVLTRVLAGKCCVGKNQYRRPPPVDPHDQHSRLYDCCVDNEKNPKIFCLFDTNQYYPEYIIEYM